MIGVTTELLVQLETGTLCSAVARKQTTDCINQRNSYRDREWQTRAGTVELSIPKLR